MRAFFLFLLLANLVFYAWAHVASEEAGAASRLRALQIGRHHRIAAVEILEALLCLHQHALHEVLLPCCLRRGDHHRLAILVVRQLPRHLMAQAVVQALCTVRRQDVANANAPDACELAGG